MVFGSNREAAQSRQSGISSDLPTIHSDSSIAEKTLPEHATDSLSDPYADVLPKNAILCCRVSFLNVILLAFGFFLNSGAYATASIVQTAVLANTNDSYFQAGPTFGYTLWAITAGTGIFAYIICPSIVAVIGPKIALVSGSVTVVLYIATLIRPYKITLYIMSAVVGLGINLMWQVQSHFIAKNSTTKRVSRNTGIFLGVYQASYIVGNLFYFFMVSGSDSIDEPTRIKIFSVLTGTAALGVVILALLVHSWNEKIPRPPSDYSELDKSGTGSVSRYRGPRDAFVGVLRAMKQPDLLKLMPLFLYTGIESSIWGVYASSLGFTDRYGSIQHALVGLFGVFAGVGEIVASALVAALGRWMHYKGKDGVLLFGMVIHIAAFYLIFLNSPENSSLGNTMDPSYIGPNPYLAMTIAFLLGLGDGIWSGQVIGYLGSAYKLDCVSVFATYYFWSSVSATVSLFYASALILPYQLLILVVFAVVGAAGFFSVEWKSLKIRLATKI